MRLGYSSSSAATHLLTELVTRPIETENDGAVIVRRRFGSRRFRIDTR